MQERRRGRKIPSLMGKSNANECNESSLSNCRVQLALSTKKDGMIFEIFIIEPTLKSKACLKCLYFTKIISDLCRYLEYFSYLYAINQTE